MVHGQGARVLEPPEAVAALLPIPAEIRDHRDIYIIYLDNYL
jgi:hypothetical protein